MEKILEVAREKAVGNSAQDLDRIRAGIKRLKFGTLELSTEQGFLKALLSGDEFNWKFIEEYKESEQYKELHAQVKQLQEENKKREEETKNVIKSIDEEYKKYLEEKEELQKIIDEVAQLED